MRHTAQSQIAALMETLLPDQGLTGSLAAGMGQAGPAELPDPAAGGTEVQDGLAHRPITKVRECQAGSCAHNAEGRRCTLTCVQINSRGGCGDYEPAADEDPESARDRETIIGISTLMPAEVDHPSDLGSMFGKFDPDGLL